jgi:hypothetical protein
MSESAKAQRRYTQTERVFIRASPELKSQMESRSIELGKSISEYIRDLVKEDLNK